MAPGESPKIQAFHRFSRFVLLEHPPSSFCSPSAMDEHFFFVGKRDITNCTYINLLCHFEFYPDRFLQRSMRRRYGIPDHDHRPFNVAYATARLAQDDSRKLQDRMRNVPTFDQPNPLGHGSTGPGIVTNILVNVCSSNESIEGGYGLAADPSPTPVTLQVSGLDKNAKQMCVSFF